MNKPNSSANINQHLHTVADLIALIGAREAAHVINLSQKQAILERRWVRKAREEFDEMVRDVLATIEKNRFIDANIVDFLPLLMAHSYEVMREGIESTGIRKKMHGRGERLAAPPPGSIPRSLKGLRKWWDDYRKLGRVPARQRALAKSLKAHFLQKVQATWAKHSEDFLVGDTASKTEIIEAMQRSADVGFGRAKMIVETETTYYFNKSRRQIYDQSDDVTHYLFVAIRDHRTTKWCKTRQGIVYAKTDPLLDSETPPIHWNCRSELLPLTKQNPTHLRLIQDRERQRRNNRPEPLPIGWTRREKVS